MASGWCIILIALVVYSRGRKERLRMDTSTQAMESVNYGVGVREVLLRICLIILQV